MDPLSISASILAILGTARGVVKVLKKLHGKKYASDEIPALINEVSTFTLLLEAINAYLTEEEAAGTENPCCQILTDQISQASILLQELNAAIEEYHGSQVKGIFRNSSQSGKLASYYGQRLQKARQSIHSTVVLLQRNSHNRAFSTLFLRLNDISTAVGESVTKIEILQASQTRTEGRLEHLAAQTAAMSGSSFNLNDSISDACSNSSAVSVTADMVDREDEPPLIPPGSGIERVPSLCTEFVVNATVGYERCRSGCPCQCHSESTVRTPLVLRNILGSLIFAFRGLAIPNVRSCDYHGCRKMGHTTFSLSYFFPTWLLARVFSLAGAWRDLSGPGVSIVVRMPRVISDDSAIFHLVETGNEEAVRNLLSKRGASPFDVSSDGRSALWRATALTGGAGPISAVQLSMVRLFINEGADVYEKDLHGHNSLDLAFDLVAMNPKGTFDLRSLFPVEDYADGMGSGFSLLHRIATGLGPRVLHLENVLGVDDRDVCKLDNRARSPLSWAAMAADQSAISALLDHGAAASALIRDASGDCPLSIAFYRGDAKCAKMILESDLTSTVQAVNRTNKYGESPIFFAVQSGNTECLDLLIQHSVDLDTRMPAGGTALHIAACYGHEDIVDMLIQAGADLEAKDQAGRSPLCATVYWGYGDTGMKLDRVARRLCRGGSSLDWVVSGFEFHPPAPAITLEAKGDQVLDGKYKIRDKECVSVLLARVHRDPDVYGSDADEFKRFRMLGENSSKLPPNAWKLFGNGTRACIGEWDATYQKLPIRVDEQLAKAGAKSIVSRAAVDVSRGNCLDAFDEWEEKGFWPTLRKLSGKSNEVSVTGARELKLEIGIGTRTNLLGQDVVTAQVSQSRLLTKPGAPSKRHIGITLPDGTTYRVGDYLAVLPLNPPAVVRRVMRRFHLPWDATVTIDATKLTVLPTGHTLSVQSLLAAILELEQPVTEPLAQGVAGTIPEDKLPKDLKDRIQKGDFQKVNTTLLDTLESHPSVTFTFGQYLAALPALHLRQCSISSTPTEKQSEVSLTYSVINAPAKGSSKGHRFLGTVTTFLESLEVGDHLQVGLCPNRNGFHLPANNKTPIIMACAGTGLAPFHGFVAERAIKKSGGSEVGPALLFYGCNHPDEDDHYREQFDEWERDGVVSMRRAYTFAPEQSKNCKFVQDRVWLNKADIADFFGKDVQG
ncbi:hypothetical protein EDB81DRAFT_954164 [Dactylonectria macrodidyma]|uniref:FAD-binding FR-type domain-containing protein n=1 Tax=Dactylonectria macrodidyma TaxID=307937 RepID=A0A9P9CZW2_9HYPO|nr:hypothetical protein EDB81DRAFT_954164 [Dactylonectria macrodidyma]